MTSAGRSFGGLFVAHANGVSEQCETEAHDDGAGGQLGTDAGSNLSAVVHHAARALHAPVRAGSGAPAPIII